MGSYEARYIRMAEPFFRFFTVEGFLYFTFVTEKAMQLSDG
jgi:hypothetical protein